VHTHATHAKHNAKAAAAVTAALKAATTSTSSSSSSSSGSCTLTSSDTTSSTTSATTDTSQDTDGQILSKIQFSQAPSAVQTGLTSLASKDGLAAPASTDTVYLGNSSGIETYSLIITSSGTTTRLAVDQTGAPVTDPTKTTTTWATLNGSGTGSNAKAAAEISAIVTALGLTAPTDTTTVDVLTASDGTVTYSIHLSKSSSSSSSSTTTDWEIYDDATVSVDANGNPVGHQELPFSVMPAAVQNGINANLPSGATALASNSTQNVDVLTANGKTFYTTSFTTSGTTSSVTVDSTGALATLPSTTTAQFSTIPQAAQTELQALATANGVSGTIATTQSVTVYDEGNGTTIYSVSLSATDSTASNPYTLTISVDQAGNPSVPPRGQGGGCGGDGGGGFGGDFGGDGTGDSSIGTDSLSGFGRRRGH
jgi:hypothetical protein